MRTDAATECIDLPLCLLICFVHDLCDAFSIRCLAGQLIALIVAYLFEFLPKGLANSLSIVIEFASQRLHHMLITWDLLFR